MQENKQLIKTLAAQVPATVYSSEVDVREENYIAIETQLTALGAGGSVTLTLQSTSDGTNWVDVETIPAYDPTDLGNFLSFQKHALGFLEKIRVKIVVAVANASLLMYLIIKTEERC